MRILGIDPGLRRLGWGVIAHDRGRLSHIAHGTCESGEGELAERLARLHAALAAVVAKHQPAAAAVEETFVNGNARATLKLGQARGVALLCPAQAGLAVAEYAPSAVKKALVGNGRAEKAQVGHMVRLLLGGVTVTPHDAADALAVAICHAHHVTGRVAA